MTTVTLSKIESAVLKALAKRRGGMTARELANTLAREGYPEYDVQRVMQRGLDRGHFELGPNLQFQAHIAAAKTASNGTDRPTARRFKK
jgi:hypothetical protein